MREYKRSVDKNSALKPVDLLLLIGELEGCYAHTKKHGFTEDNEILDKMKKKYYSMYFRLLKEQS